MEKLTIKQATVVILFLTSIYSGLIYIFLLIPEISLLNDYGSNFGTVSSITNVVALAFIIFTLVLLVSIYFLEKIMKRPIITGSIIIVGALYLFVSFTWVIELFYLSLILTVLVIGYLTPSLIKYTSDLIDPETNKSYSKYILPICVIFWFLISWFLFDFFENESTWRLLYMVTGIINIVSSAFIYVV